MDRHESSPVFKTKHGSVNLEAWGPPKQSRLADWFRLQVHLFRWQKSATGPSRSAWDKEYRLRMRDVPDFLSAGRSSRLSSRPGPRTPP